VSLKCTRYEYLVKTEAVIKDIISNDKTIKNDHILEISGNTMQWSKYYKKVTRADYPEIDAHNLPYPDNYFDCVAYDQVLEHVKKPWVCVDEAHRVLKPGGIIIITSPFFYQEHPHPTDYWRFTTDGLAVLVENFSKIILKEKSGNYKMMLHMIKNPTDRRSKEFQKIQYLPNDKIECIFSGKVISKNAYYVNSTIIAQK